MHDLRMIPAALAAWAGAAWLVTTSSLVALVVAVSAVAVGAMLLHRQGPGTAALVVTAVCLAAVASSCAWRLTMIEHSPLTTLAQAHRLATLDVEVRRDASTFTQHGRQSVVVEVIVHRVVTSDVDISARGRATAFVKGDATGLVVGRRLDVVGRLQPSDSSDEVALIDVVRRGPADRASWWWEASERVREGVRRSVAPTGAKERALVPALVDGDDDAVTDDLAEDFRRSGLTHLMAVSGTNLTIVLSVVLLVGRAAGARRRGLWVLGTVSITAFVLLARPDPSVLRAAAMGAVGIAALGLGARGGVRSLSWAVMALVFVDPWLARSAGFILSVCATAGILLLAPALVRRLVAWLPRWCAMAIAVPLAAQLACTPALAAISGQVSLVAVLANLLAAPAVAPATITGLLGGLVALVSPPMSHLPGVVAGACASWILAVAHRTASLDAASLQWEAPWQLLVAIVPPLTWAIIKLASRPLLFVGVALGLLVGIWRPPYTGWPPPGWLMVACDVGQGDATVLSVGDGSAVVVDAGPTPAAINRCLDRLDVHRVQLMVFTHAHADHVSGWSGVRSGREVDQVAVGPTGGPASGRIPRHQASTGETFTVGDIHARVVWPNSTGTLRAESLEGSAANNASVVLDVDVGGARLLLTGDVEEQVQEQLARAVPDLRADVVKVSHHGSARQSPRLLATVRARLATISVGADNDYGHPAATTLSMLRAHGVQWWRTDLDGDIAIVRREERLLVVTR